VYNPFFDVSNNLVSAWMARFFMEEEFILVNGDDIFHQRVLQGLLEHTEDICMVIDRKEAYDDDDMKVITRGDRVLQVAKTLPLSEANGESIGMMKFAGHGCRIMRETLDRMVRDKANLNIFYLAALQAIMDSGFPVHYHECDESDWAEVDIHPDLKSVRDMIQKHLERLRKKVE
jgi:choline kinase